MCKLGQYLKPNQINREKNYKKTLIFDQIIWKLLDHKPFVDLEHIS